MFSQLTQYNNIYIYSNGSSFILRNNDRIYFCSLNDLNTSKFDQEILNYFNSLYIHQGKN